MEKYSLVKGDGTGDAFLEATTGCEVRITQQGKPRNYISYAMGILVRRCKELYSEIHFTSLHTVRLIDRFFPQLVCVYA
jgi:hypothetical protein